MQRLALVLALAIAGAAPAVAHPHVWANMQSEVLFSPDGLVTGVRVAWTFDKGYTQQAVDGLDTNGDGVYSADELAPLTQVNLQSLKTYGYFVFFRANGELVKIGDATDPDQSYAKGQLTLRFTVPLVKPLDPRRDQVKLKVYDPEFFIDFEYAKKNPISTSAGLPQSCRTELTPIPTGNNIDSTRTLLASKGIDWKPDNNEDFGGMFAQAILVECKS